MGLENSDQLPTPVSQTGSSLPHSLVDASLFAKDWMRNPTVFEESMAMPAGIRDTRDFSALGYEKSQPDTSLLYHLDDEMRLVSSVREALVVDCLHDPDHPIALGQYYNLDSRDYVVREIGMQIPVESYDPSKSVVIYARAGDLEELEVESVNGKKFDPYSLRLYRFEGSGEEAQLVEITEKERSRIMRNYDANTRNSAISEAMKRRRLFRGGIENAAKKRRDNLKPLVKNWTWRDTSVGPRQEPHGPIERVQLVYNTVGEIFLKAYKMTHNEVSQRDRWQSFQDRVHWNIVGYAKKLFLTGAISVKNIVVPNFNQRLENWWENVEMEKGSPHLKTGIGGWISQWKLGKYFGEELKNMKVPELEHTKAYLMKTTAGLVYAAAKRIPDSTHTRRGLSKRRSRYAVVTRKGIDHIVDISEKDPQTIGTKVAEVFAADPSGKSGDDKNQQVVETDAMSYLLANLNNELPKNRKKKLTQLLRQYKLPLRQMDRIHRRVMRRIKMLENAEFSISIGSDPYNDSQIGMFNAGLCKQALQLHIDEEKFIDGGVDGLSAYVPHWNYDVSSHLELMKGIITDLAGYIATPIDLESKQTARVLVADGVRREGMDRNRENDNGQLMKDLMDVWENLSGEQKKATTSSLDQFASSSLDMKTLHVVVDRMNNNLRDNLLDRQDGQVNSQRTMSRHSLANMIKTSKDLQWQQLAELKLSLNLSDQEINRAKDLIAQRATVPVVTTFHLLGIAHMLARRRSKEMGAVMFPVDRGEKRLGIGIAAINQYTYEQFDQLSRTLEKYDFLANILNEKVLPKNDGEYDVEKWAEEAAEALSQTEVAKEGGSSFFDYLAREQIREMRQETIRAVNGNSLQMVIATSIGSRAFRKAYSWAAEVIRAKDESTLVGQVAQISCVTTKKFNEWGKVRGPVVALNSDTPRTETRDLAQFVSFSGAFNNPDNPSEVLAVVEHDVDGESAPAEISVRIPGKHAKNEKAAEVFFDHFNDALGLVSTLGMSKDEWREILIEYANYSLEELKLVQTNHHNYWREGTYRNVRPILDFLSERITKE